MKHNLTKRYIFVPPGSLDSMEPVPEIHEEEEVKEKEEEVGLFSTGIVYMGCILSMIKSKIAEWTIEVSLIIVSYCIYWVRTVTTPAKACGAPSRRSLHTI